MRTSLERDAGSPVPLPASFAEAVAAEWRRVWRFPFDVPIAIAVNAALMSVLWFLLPTKLKDELFTFHGSFLYAVVLAAWMYSDVPSTNVLGPDAARVLEALDDDTMLRRLLNAKVMVLWLLIVPVCLVVAVISGLQAREYLVTLYSAICIAIVPLGALMVSQWVGIALPYHPMPIRYRLTHRKPFGRKIVRWVIVVLIPYGLVPLLSTLMIAPSLLIWGLKEPNGLTKSIPHRDLGLGIAVACGISALVALLGQKVASRLVERRRERLRAFLSDPVIG